MPGQPPVSTTRFAVLGAGHNHCTTSVNKAREAVVERHVKTLHERRDALTKQIDSERAIRGTKANLAKHAKAALDLEAQIAEIDAELEALK